MRVIKNQVAWTHFMAKFYQDLGWCPIPVPGKSKAPKIKNWPHFELTQDYNWNECNLGIILGTRSDNLADVDLDAVEAIKIARDLLPETGFIFGRESKPNSHFLYRISDLSHRRPLQLRDPVQNDMLLEIRVSYIEEGELKGQQTVFPDSIHPSGEYYFWEDFETVFKEEVPEISYEELATAVKEIGVIVLMARKWKRGIRHDLALSWAGMLAVNGVDLERCKRLTKLVCKTAEDLDWKDRRRCIIDTYKSFKDGEKITGVRHLAELIDRRVVNKLYEWLEIDSGESTEFTYDEGNGDWCDPIPLDVTKRPEWPPDVFPQPFQSYVNYLSESSETPIELPAMMLLAVLGTVTQRKFRVQVECDYREPLSLWCLVCMGSGTRKTSVHDSIIAPLVDWQRREKREMADEIVRAKSRYDTTKARIDELRKKAAKADSVEVAKELEEEIIELELQLPNIPSPPQLLTTDITPENLASFMRQNYERAGIVGDEGGMFETIGGRYSHGVSNLDIFLKSHSGSYMRIDRGSRPSIDLYTPAISFGLAVQEDVLRGFKRKPEFRGRGFLARFLYAVPRDLLGFRTHEKKERDHQKLTQKYKDAMTRIIDLRWDRDDHGEETGHFLFLMDEAYQIWKEFQIEVEMKMRPGNRFEYLKDWAGKLPGLVIRLAGNLHVAQFWREEPALQKISPDVMDRAIQLGRALSDHALIAFDTMDDDPALEGARAILGWIKRTQSASFTFRDVHYALKTPYPKRAQLEPSMSLLEERHFIRRRRPPEQKGRGRPSEIYDVNPLILDAC